VTGNDYDELKNMQVTPQIIIMIKGITLSSHNVSGLKPEIKDELIMLYPQIIDWIKNNQENEDMTVLYSLAMASILVNAIKNEVEINASLRNINNTIAKIELMNTNP